MTENDKRGRYPESSESTVNGKNGPATLARVSAISASPNRRLHGYTQRVSRLARRVWHLRPFTHDLTSMSDSDSEQTHFVPQEDDEETLWEVIEILAEKGNRYRVRWAGVDPATNKPWAPSWVPKRDCTDDLVRAWKKKKAKSTKSKVVVAKTKKAVAGTGGKTKGKGKARAESEEIPVYEAVTTSYIDSEEQSSRATRSLRRSAMQQEEDARRPGQSQSAC